MCDNSSKLQESQETLPVLCGLYRALGLEVIRLSLGAELSFPRRRESRINSLLDPRLREGDTVAHGPRFLNFSVSNTRTTIPETVQELPKDEIGGRKEGLDPTRYNDWELNGRAIDF